MATCSHAISNFCRASSGMNSKNHQRNLLSVVRLYLRFTMMLSMLGTSWFDTNLTMAPLTVEGVHDFIVPHTRLTPCACIFCEPGISNGSKLVLYADDILLYRAIDSPDDYALLQHDVNTLGAWSSIKLLKFNPSKCKTMFISRRRLRKSEPNPLFLNGSLIEAVDCIKHLGISIASDLSWSQHIQFITSKAR